MVKDISNSTMELELRFSFLLRVFLMVSLSLSVLFSTSSWAKEYNVACVPRSLADTEAVSGFTCPSKAAKCKPEIDFLKMSQKDYVSGENVNIEIPIFQLQIDESTLKALGDGLIGVAGSKFKCVRN